MADDNRTDALVTGPFHPRTLALLQVALDAWQARGFRYVDLPWMVPKAFSDATRPSFCRDIPTLHGSFVASGEQSFLQLWQEGRLPKRVAGYVGWTPCLRDEAVLDETHQHGFMKAEWFVPLSKKLTAEEHFRQLQGLVSMQTDVFYEVSRVLGWRRKAYIHEEPTREGLDLVLGSIEIGSYGIRTFDGKPYMYGTALALPRFTQALLSAHC